MIRALVSHFHARRQKRLEAARAIAREAFEDAINRGDTRAMAETYARLRDCTTLALKGAR